MNYRGVGIEIGYEIKFSIFKGKYNENYVTAEGERHYEFLKVKH